MIQDQPPSVSVIHRKSDLKGDHDDLDLRVFFRIFYGLWNIDRNADDAGFPGIKPEPFQFFCQLKKPEVFREIGFHEDIYPGDDKRAPDQNIVISPSLTVQIQYSYNCVPRSESRGWKEAVVLRFSSLQSNVWNSSSSTSSDIIIVRLLLWSDKFFSGRVRKTLIRVSQQYAWEQEL